MLITKIGKSVYRQIALAERAIVDPNEKISSDTEYTDYLSGRTGSRRTLIYKRVSNESCMNRFLDSINPENMPDQKIQSKSAEESIKQTDIKLNNAIIRQSPYFGKVLPCEKDIQKNELYKDMKKFNIEEEVTICTKSEFPPNIVKQQLGDKLYKNLSDGDIVEEFMILYDLNKSIHDCIILPIENYTIIRTMIEADCENYRFTRFLDHFNEKEAIKLECKGQNTFHIVAAKDKTFMKDMSITGELYSNNNFYIRINSIW